VWLGIRNFGGKLQILSTQTELLILQNENICMCNDVMVHIHSIYGASYLAVRSRFLYLVVFFVMLCL